MFAIYFFCFYKTLLEAGVGDSGQAPGDLPLSAWKPGFVPYATYIIHPAINSTPDMPVLEQCATNLEGRRSE